MLISVHWWMFFSFIILVFTFLFGLFLFFSPCPFPWSALKLVSKKWNWDFSHLRKILHFCVLCVQTVYATQDMTRQSLCNNLSQKIQEKTLALNWSNLKWKMRLLSPLSCILFLMYSILPIRSVWAIMCFHRKWMTLLPLYSSAVLNICPTSPL